MNTSELLELSGGIVLGIAILPIVAAHLGFFTVSVDDEEAVLVTRFGKLVATLREPGLHFLPGRLLPWVKLQRVSLRRDFRHLRDIHVNDARGTTVMVDLWLEFAIEDPVKATFGVADWDRSLQNLVTHAATSILGNHEFQEILCHRTELGEALRRDLGHETERWGIRIELMMVRNVSLLPDVSRQIFESIAARLERAKADLEEAGRLAVAKLEADTSVRVAAFVAEAKSQYPLAIGRAYATLSEDGEIYEAYRALYDLSLVRPHRTITFRGFGEAELRSADAAMLAPPLVDGAAGLVTPLGGSGEDARLR